MKKINDKIFGELEIYDLGWQKTYTISMFDENFIITLSIDGEDEITEMQRKSFQVFHKNKVSYLKLAENKLFDYYSKNNSQIRSYIESYEWDFKAPIINSKYELVKLIRPREIIIPEDIENETITFGITFDCSWIGDHTLVIRFDNDEITIGNEEIIY